MLILKNITLFYYYIIVETPAFTSSEEEDTECSINSEYEEIEDIPASSEKKQINQDTYRLTADLDKCKVSETQYIY